MQIARWFEPLADYQYLKKSTTEGGTTMMYRTIKYDKSIREHKDASQKVRWLRASPDMPDRFSGCLAHFVRGITPPIGG